MRLFEDRDSTRWILGDLVSQDDVKIRARLALKGATLTLR
jgi:hypothetical protein